MTIQDNSKPIIFLTSEKQYATFY